MTDVSELGRFWLPCDPEDFVEGTLIVDENGVTLVTQGQLLVSGLWNREPRTIHGVLATDHVKLVDALLDFTQNLEEATDAITLGCRHSWLESEGFSLSVANARLCTKAR